jgi:hypothetical protein
VLTAGVVFAIAPSLGAVAICGARPVRPGRRDSAQLARADRHPTKNQPASQSLRILLDLIRPLKKLTTDPTLWRGIRVRLGLLMAYIALPCVAQDRVEVRDQVVAEVM